MIFTPKTFVLAKMNSKVPWIKFQAVGSKDEMRVVRVRDGEEDRPDETSSDDAPRSQGSYPGYA